MANASILAAILFLRLQPLPGVLSQEISASSDGTEVPAGPEDVCEMGEDGSCLNPETAEPAEPEEYELDVETLPRLHSKKKNMFIYDLEDELSEETVNQLMNVSSLIHANKSLNVIWMVTKSVPKNFRNFKRFAKKVLEHIMVNETETDEEISEAQQNKLLRKAVGKCLLLLLQSERNVVTPYAGKYFNRKVRIASVKRAIRKGRKSIKEGDYDEALLKIAKMLVKATFAKRGFFDAIRSMGMLVIPAVAIFFFMRKKQGGGVTSYLEKQRRGLPRMMESTQQRMARIRAVRSKLLSDAMTSGSKRPGGDEEVPNLAPVGDDDDD